MFESPLQSSTTLGRSSLKRTTLGNRGVSHTRLASLSHTPPPPGTTLTLSHVLVTCAPLPASMTASLTSQSAGDTGESKVLPPRNSVLSKSASSKEPLSSVCDP